MISMQKFKPCKPIEGDNTRKELIFKRFGADQAALLKDVKALDKDIEINEGEIELGYENLTMVEALRVILLEKGAKKNGHQEKENGAAAKLTEKDIPSGFETIGDVAHMNFSQA